MKAKFIMDCYGHIQIEVDGQKSEPTTYDSMATLEKDGKTYIGVSENYGGMLPTECVLEVTKLESETVDAEVCNLFHPEQPCKHLEIKAKLKEKAEKNEHKDGG